jgi:hypothetical protein
MVGNAFQAEQDGVMLRANFGAAIGSPNALDLPHGRLQPIAVETGRNFQ